MTRGCFITFEGPDGAGKTTQIKRLAQWLQKEGWDVVLTREPGGTAISDRVRHILLDPEHREMENETEVLLYAASRAQHVREKIVPALSEGKVVLCDRFVDASIAYQGHGLELSVRHVEEVNRFATGGLRPDRTYLLDIPVEIGRKRILERNGNSSAKALDRIEQKQIEFHQRVRDAFLTLAEQEKERIRYVDANRSPEAIAIEIQRDVHSFLQTFKDETGWKARPEGGNDGENQ